MSRKSRVTSAPDLPVSLTIETPPIPVGGFSVLGNAKLLPQVVHVKRETLQVVSLAMTGLVPDWSQDFHKNSVLSSQFSVLSSQFSVLSSQFSVLSSQFSVLSSQVWLLVNNGCLEM
jgi:hypothetical protein